MTHIANKKIISLKREAKHSDNPAFLYQLIGESIARKWFTDRNIQCWRTSQPPNARGRYSVFFRDGVRAMVAVVSKTPISFDSMAKAKCSFLIGVSLESESSGEVLGFKSITDCREYGFDKRVTPSKDDLIPIEKLLSSFPPSPHFRISYFFNSLRLFLTGSFTPPWPGLGTEQGANRGDKASYVP